MKKKLKLLFSMIAFCLALGSLSLGVYAALSVTYSVNGSVTYNVDYGLMEITTSVYKYDDKTITQEEGESFMGICTSFEKVPGYNYTYATYDKNDVIKEDISGQRIQDIDLDYRDGSAYFIVVHVTSKTKGKIIRATVSSNFNVTNSWSVNSGDTIILNNSSGKNIIFASGVIDPSIEGEGSFSYSITFDVEDEYEPQDTGYVQFALKNNQLTNEYLVSYQETFNEFTESDTITKTFEGITVTKDQLVPVGDAPLSYSAMFNINAGNFKVDKKISYRIKNVKYYDQYGAEYAANATYVSVKGKNYENYSYYLIDSLSGAINPSTGTAPIKETATIYAGKQYNGAYGFTINNSYIEAFPTLPIFNSMTFDVEITVTEYIIDTSNTSDFNYRYFVKGNYFRMIEGSEDEIYLDIIPTSFSSDHIDNFEFDGKFDIEVKNDYVKYMTVNARDIHDLCLVSSGSLLIDEYKDFYGNFVVFEQVATLYIWDYFLSLLGLEYLPIVKETTTLNLGFSQVTLEPENWFQDISIVFQYVQNNVAEANEVMSRYFIPMPSNLSQVTIPLHMYRLDNAPISILELSAAVILIMGEELTSFYDTILNIEFATYYEAINQGLIDESVFGLGNDYTYRDVIIALLEADELPELPSTDGMDAIDFEYYSIVPGTHVFGQEMTNLCNSIGSSYYTFNNVDVKKIEGLDTVNLSRLNCQSFTTSDPFYSEEDGILYSADGTKLCSYPAGRMDESFTIPSNVTEIGAYAFEHSKLKTIDLQNGTLQIVGTKAFAYVNMPEIVFPNSVTSFGSSVFDDSKVKTIYLNAQTVVSNCSTENLDLDDSINESKIETVILTGNSVISTADFNNIKGMLNPYIQFAYNDVTTNLVFEEHATLDGYVITQVYNSSEINIPETINGRFVIGIGDGAFSSCSNLSSLTLPSTIQFIGNNNFANCNNLTRVYFDDADITNIGTGNVRVGVEYYTQSETTLSTLRRLDYKVLALNIEYLVQRLRTSGEAVGSDFANGGSFSYILNIAGKSISINETFGYSLSGALNNTLVLYQNNAGIIDINLETNLAVRSSSQLYGISDVREEVTLSKLNFDGSSTAFYNQLTRFDLLSTSNTSYTTPITTNYPTDTSMYIQVETGDIVTLHIRTKITESINIQLGA